MVVKLKKSRFPRIRFDNLHYFTFKINFVRGNPPFWPVLIYKDCHKVTCRRSSESGTYLDNTMRDHFQNMANSNLQFTHTNHLFLNSKVCFCQHLHWIRTLMNLDPVTLMTPDEPSSHPINNIENTCECRVQRQQACR